MYGVERTNHKAQSTSNHRAVTLAMQSQLRKFILYSILLHLLVLVLFSFQNRSKQVEPPLVVSLTEKVRTSSSSSKSQSTSQNKATANTPNPTTQKFKSFNSQAKINTLRPNNTSTAKSTPSPKPVQTSTAKVNDPAPTTLIRNKPSTTRKAVSVGTDTSEITDNRITINNSKDLARGVSAASSSSKPSTVTGSQSGFGSGTLGVSGGNNSTGSGEGFSLNSNPAGGSSGSSSSFQSAGGGSSGKGNDNLNWKGSGQRSLLSRDELVFPQHLQGKGVNEEVIVSFKVTPDGRVFDIEVIKSSGYPELDSAVKDQVRSFRFNSVSAKKINSAEYNYMFDLTQKNDSN